MSKPFAEALDIANQNLGRARRKHEEITSVYEAGNIEKAYERAFAFAAACETLTLQARDLPAYTGKIAARQMMRNQIRDLFPITIREYPDENMLAFSLPALLPRKEKGSALYIRLSLYAAFTDYFRKRPLFRIDNCVIVIRHRYEATRPEREYRDHDNIELNAVIDTIAVFALVDDSPLRCDHYYCSAPAERNATEVFLIPRERFSCWFDGERNMEL